MTFTDLFLLAVGVGFGTLSAVMIPLLGPVIAVVGLPLCLLEGGTIGVDEFDWSERELAMGFMGLIMSSFLVTAWFFRWMPDSFGLSYATLIGWVAIMIVVHLITIRRLKKVVR